MATINITGTGGIIEGNLGSANVNVNLDPVYGNFNSDTSSTLSNDNDFDDMWAGNGGLFSAWIYAKSDGEGNFGRIASKNQWLITLRSESSGFCKIQFNHTFDSDDGAWQSTDRVIPVNSWCHVAVFYDSDSASNNAVIYVNGVAVAITEDDTPTGTRDSDASSDLYIGNQADGTRGFDGYMMDIKIYKNTAWTQPEIAVLASKINVDKDNPGLPAPGPRLYLWWKGNASTGTDSSGSGNNLTASNLGSVVYDAFSVDVQDNSTTTDGTFTVTQGKVEGLSLTSLDFDGSSDKITSTSFTLSHDNSTFAVWVKKSNATGNEDTIIGQASDPNQHWLKIDTDGDIELRDYPNTLRCDTAITDTNWHHLAVTMNGDSNGAIYVDGVAQTLTSNAITADPSFDVHGIRGTIDEFHGKMRDSKVFDYALSAEQVASLYSGTYPQTPEHNWKMNDGGLHPTGEPYVEDFGTGTDSDGVRTGATWSNGTLDLDGDLTVAANGTLSAPRGLLTFGGGTFDNNGTDPTTSYIHNDGTFEFDSSGNAILRGGSSSTGTIFFNLFHDSGGYVDTYEYYKVINKLTVDNSRSWYLNGSTHVKIGDTTRNINGELEINGVLNLSSSNTGTGTSNSISGDNTNAGGAALVDINNGASSFANGAAKATEFKNLNFDGAFTTAGNSFIVKCMGDMEFDAVTVSSGDTLNVNGQRIQCIDWTQTGGGSPSALNIDDSLCIVSGHVDWNGIIPTANTGTKLIHSTSAEKNWRSNYTGDGTFMCTGTQTTMTGYQWASGSDQLDNVIIGSGVFNSNSLNNSTDNLTIATGGTYTAGSTTVTCAGDFTTSGGLIGKSAMVVSGDNDYEGMSVTELQAQGDWNFSGAEGLTIEGWFKFDDLDFGTGNDAILAGHVRSGDTTGKRYGCGLQIMDDKVMAIASNNDTAHTMYDNCSFPVSDLTAGKWHHIAMTADANNSATPVVKLYLDGKLKKQVTGVTTIYYGYNFVVGGYADNHDSQNWTNRRMDGTIARVSCFRQEMTAAQLRSMMFTTYTEMAALSGGVDEAKCVGWWQFDEGTGTTVDNKGTAGAPPSSDHSNFDGVIASAGTTWAGAGTFTRGTSTLKMTGAGKSLNYLSGEELGHLLIDNSSGTVTASVLTGTNNLTVSSLTINDSSASFTAPSGTLTIDNKVGDYAYDNDGAFVHSSGTMSITTSGTSRIDSNGTSGNINNLIYNSSGNTLETHTATTLDGNLTITAGTIDTLSSSNLALTVTGDVSIAGTLTGNASAITIGKMLEITNGGTYTETSGTTLISGQPDGDYVLRNHDGGTYTKHATGILKIARTSASGTKYAKFGEDVYNDVILENTSSGSVVAIVGVMNLAGDLTVVEGELRSYGGTGAIDIDGDVSIEDGGKFSTETSQLAAGGVNADFGSLTIASGGEYDATPLTTTITSKTSDNYGIKGGGTFTHNNGEVKVTGNAFRFPIGVTYYDFTWDTSSEPCYLYSTTLSGGATIDGTQNAGYTAILGTLKINDRGFLPYSATKVFINNLIIGDTTDSANATTFDMQDSDVFDGDVIVNNILINADGQLKFGDNHAGKSDALEVRGAFRSLGGASGVVVV